METLGFVGLGNLGTPMAQNFQKAGYPMVVHDLREEATRPLLEEGARLGGSPAEVARLSDVTFTSLPGPKEVEEVAIGPKGVLEGIREGSVYVDLSTSRPALIRRMEPMFCQKGAHVLDAPVLSSPTRAATKDLAVMVGGDRQIFERIRPMLEAFSDNVIYAGSLGSGSVCKLVNNMMTFGVRQVIAEGLTLGLKAGLDLEVILDAGRRYAVESVRPALAGTVFRGQFEPPGFALALARKDSGLATELGPGVQRASADS